MRLTNKISLLSNFKYDVSFRLIWAITFICISLCVDAQNIANDLKKMNAKNQHSDLFLAKMTVNVFASEGVEKPVITQKYVIKKKGNNLFYQIDKKRILMNTKCVIVVDDKNKKVTYSKNNGASPLANQTMDVNVDSLVKAYDAVDYKGLKKGLKHYVLNKKGSPIPKIEIYFNSTGNKLAKLVYHYDKKFYPTNNLVEIIYTKWSYNPVFKADEFSEKKYIKKVNNKIELVAALKKYTLVINDI